MLLNKIDMNDVYNELLKEYAYPVTEWIWKITGKSEYRAENFIVKYDNESEGFQNHLKIHHDSSKFTFVLGLNDTYEGGGTWFPKQKILLDEPIGTLSVHPTLTHRHGARCVIEGVRYTLISFVHKS